jgi:cellulose 1,4-beta-cellobiosidase
MYRALTIASSLLAVASGQLVGTQQTETHPGMTWQQCTAKGSCTSKNGKVVIDANWRWLHTKTGYWRLAGLASRVDSDWEQIHQLLHWQ